MIAHERAERVDDALEADAHGRRVQARLLKSTSASASPADAKSPASSVGHETWKFVTLQGCCGFKAERRALVASLRSNRASSVCWTPRSAPALPRNKAQWSAA